LGIQVPQLFLIVLIDGFGNGNGPECRGSGAQADQLPGLSRSPVDQSNSPNRLPEFQHDLNSSFATKGIGL
jgi:hypothetical protein